GPGKLCVQCEAGVIEDFAVVFVKPYGGALQWADDEVAFDVFIGHRFVLSVGSLPGSAVRTSQTKRGYKKSNRNNFRPTIRFHAGRKGRRRFARCQKFPMSDDGVVFNLRRKMRRSIVLPLLACVTLLGILSGVGAQEAPSGKNENDNGYAQISLFAKAIELIRQDYVDVGKTSYQDLVTAALKGMLSSLDPHSQFMDPNDFRDMQEDTRSRFNGLGIEVAMTKGLLTVVPAIEDSTAAMA